MTEQNRQPLEESPEFAAAIEDDVAVPQFITGGGTDDDTPEFREPVGGGTDEPVARTGSDQPWDPEDLALAEGRDATPENVERARHELERDGAAAIERTVP